MGRFAEYIFGAVVLLVSCSLTSSCTREPAGQSHPAVSQTNQQPPDEPSLLLSEDVKRNLKVVRGGNLVVLTMPMSAGRAGVDLGHLELDALPSGCVILRQKSGQKDYWPVIWPGGTEISADGTITADFDPYPRGNFRIGQTVTGGNLGKWSAEMMKPPKEVTDVCPADRYLRVDSLELPRR